MFNDFKCSFTTYFSKIDLESFDGSILRSNSKSSFRFELKFTLLATLGIIHIDFSFNINYKTKNIAFKTLSITIIYNSELGVGSD